MALALAKAPLPSIALPVYHFAPERAISAHLQSRFGDHYVAADFAPEAYPWVSVPVRKVDLSKAREYLGRETLGGAVHSHVLEHIPGSIERVICEINDSIAPGGFHIFQAPIEPGWFRENMDPALDKDERTRVFGQHDHLRVFGARDFHERILRHFNDFEQLKLSSLLTIADLKLAGVPATSLNHFTSHSVFIFVKKQS